MNVRCINVENYNLTEGKIYPVADQSRDFYRLLNDNNVGVRYAKRLFEVVPDNEAPARATPQPVRPAVVVPPPPPRRTEADLVRSIAFVNDQVVFNNFENQRVIIQNCFTRYGTEISCGVSQQSGLNSQIEEIDDQFDDADDYLTIRKALLKECIVRYIQNKLLGHNNAFALLSTNISDNDEDILTVLDDLAHASTEIVNNPNSGNDIQVWILAAA